MADTRGEIHRWLDSWKLVIPADGTKPRVYAAKMSDRACRVQSGDVIKRFNVHYCYRVAPDERIEMPEAEVTTE